MHCLQPSIEDQMNIANTFENELHRAMDSLDKNEWAVTRVREKVMHGIKPHEAFSSIVEVVLLAAMQKAPYVYASCCWLARELAEHSNTTERPKGFEIAIRQAMYTGAALHAEKELAPLIKWYRYDA